jgi:hypothetical protein
MTEEEYQVYRHEAVHALMAMNDQRDEKYGISKFPRWNYDLDAGVQVFSKNGVAKIIAKIQAVGTTANSSNNWLWSWANSSFPEQVTDLLQQVRDFGEREGLKQLTEKSWQDDEYLGWEMTAVAARILGAVGGYRCPSEKGFLYLVHTKIWVAEPGQTVEEVIAQENKKRVVCGNHGSGFSTYLCEHLCAEPGQEWFSDTQSEEKPWPDAWCAKCDEVFQEQGEWNDVNSARLKIKLICHHCYEAKRKVASAQ